jgi:hypothetical protein
MDGGDTLVSVDAAEDVDNPIAPARVRHPLMADIGFEHVPIHAALEGEGRHHPVEAQPRDQGDVGIGIAWRGRVSSLPRGSSPVQTAHPEVSAELVEKDEPAPRHPLNLLAEDFTGALATFVRQSLDGWPRRLRSIPARGCACSPAARPLSLMSSPIKRPLLPPKRPSFGSEKCATVWR